MKHSLAHKFDRAEALGWSRALPAWCGPCSWLRRSKKERREIKNNLRYLRANVWLQAAGEGT